MSFLSFDINKNHIYFILIFISYFIREVSLEKMKDYLNKESDDDDFKFGNSKNVVKKLFNMYIFTLSNLLSFICIIIIKINTRHKLRSSETIRSDHKSAGQIKLIYSGNLPINKKKLLIRTLILTLCDFFAQYSVFMLYFLCNDDNLLVVKDRMDFISIINILSIYLFSMIILKTCYYKHHYLSFVINVFCLIILCAFELQALHFNKYIISYLAVRALSQILYSLEDVFGKMALIEEFLSPYSLLIYKGIYELIILILFSIPFFFIKRKDIIIFSKFDVFINTSLKVFLYFIVMVLNFSYNILIWIIIDRFSPNDLAMTTVIENITDKLLMLINKDDFKVYLYIISFTIYLILIIGVCIHNEIIIINKYGLNEYTKKRLGTKGDEDVELTRKTNRISNCSFNEENIIKKKKY